MGLSNPCCLPVGLKCPPADLKSGGSHFGFWWKCTACSPGGRSLSASLTSTPCPLPTMVAVPTLVPFASFNSTVFLVTGFACAHPVAAYRVRAIATVRERILSMYFIAKEFYHEIGA